jgi:hypothetical protein
MSFLWCEVAHVDDAPEERLIRPEAAAIPRETAGNAGPFVF